MCIQNEKTLQGSSYARQNLAQKEALAVDSLTPFNYYFISNFGFSITTCLYVTHKEKFS